MDPVQYEAHLRGQMVQTMGLLLIVYLPVQIGAILIVRHWITRLAAGLPIPVILPVMITGFETGTYEDGSLYGLGLMVISVPVMLYLALFFVAGLAGRASSIKASESESTNARAGKRIALLLMSLAVLLSIAALIGMILLVPR